MKLTGLKFIDDLDLSGERVFLRGDFNVPLQDGEVSDDMRLQSALPSIRYAFERADKLILASHLGRPGGKRDESLSLEPVGHRIADLLDAEVVLPEDLTGDPVHKLIEEMGPDQLVLLENLRFDPGERDADPEFAEQLADLADVYINDAFGALHRAHASVYAMAQFFDRGARGAGFLVQSELKHLAGLLDEPNRPMTAIMGGVKVSDKIGVVEKIARRVDNLLIGGAMAYTFLRAQDTAVGDSEVEGDFIDTATSILETADEHDTDVILPLDHVVAPDLDAPKSEIRTTNDVSVKAGLKGFDIGPNTIDAFSEIIRSSRTVFWNGPLGVFEREPYDKGTAEIAQTLALAPSKSIVGGGDTSAAVRKAGLAEQMDHISTGGGAALELIRGRALPGLQALLPGHDFE